MKSLPAGERGLKLERVGGWDGGRRSLPAGERGLKPMFRQSPKQNQCVAPRGGAWIETLFHIVNGPVHMSLPVGERGLKHALMVDTCTATKSLPMWGAWIETLRSRVVSGRDFVAPRGGAWIETHTVCGLFCVHHVAPHGGAWIETVHLSRHLDCRSRSPWGSVD